MIRGFDSC